MSKLFTALSSSSVRQSNKTVLVIAATFLLFISMIFFFSRAVIAYNNAQSVLSQNRQMKDTINKWKEQVNFIKQQDYRPVKADQINNVTSDILVLVQVHNLNLADFKASAITGSKDKKDPFQTFNMKVSGKYEDVVKFLMNFKAKDALVSLMSVDMTSSKDIVTASLSYRIYIK